MANVLVRYEIKVNNHIEENYRVYASVEEAKNDISFVMKHNKTIEAADIAPIAERVSRLGDTPIMVEVF